MPFYPHFVLRELLVWLGMLAVLVALATFLPWELGHKADPFAPAPEGIRPEWYFTFMSQTLKYLPPTIAGIEGEHVGILAFAALALLLFAVPFLDRRAARQPQRTLCAAVALRDLQHVERVDQRQQRARRRIRVGAQPGHALPRHARMRGAAAAGQRQIQVGDQIAEAVDADHLAARAVRRARGRRQQPRQRHGGRAQRLERPLAAGEPRSQRREHVTTMKSGAGRVEAQPAR